MAMLTHEKLDLFQSQDHVRFPAIMPWILWIGCVVDELAHLLSSCLHREHLQSNLDHPGLELVNFFGLDGCPILLLKFEA